MKKSNLITVSISALLLAACATKPTTLYQWGSYQSSIYEMYDEPSKMDAQAYIQKLEADYQLARAANKPVPPGYHAQLGYLYFKASKSEQALSNFTTEKTLFPESEAYMNRLINQIKSGK